MALPRDQRAEVDRLLGHFCENRVPPQHRAMIRYEYTVQGNSVTLTEFRPSSSGGKSSIDLAVAKFRFNAATAEWTLFWQRASGRWQLCDWRPPAKRFATVLAEIVADRYGAFFG